MTENHPISAKDQSILHQFGKIFLPGTFLGNVLYAVSIRERDILIADMRSWKSWSRPIFMIGDSMRRRISCRIVVSMSSVKFSGRDQVFRKSTAIQDYPAPGEEHNHDLQGESDGSQPLDT